MKDNQLGLIARIRNYLSGARQITALREYKAARHTRLAKNWTTWNRSANAEIYSSLRRLRARSREACQNDPLFKKYLSMCRNNIGVLKLQIEARKPTGKYMGEPDVELNRAVEELWWEFCQANNFSASGKLSAHDFQSLCVTSAARDGEILAQIVKDPGLKFGIALKTYSADYLDETLNRSENGNRVIMSVEVNGNNKPVFYHLTTPTSGRMYAEDQERKTRRVPAEEIIHSFRVLDEEEQVRGIPWTHAALLKAKYLEAYEDAVLIAAQMGANAVMTLERDSPKEEPQATPDGETGMVDELTFDSRPGQVNELDPGVRLSGFKPEHPTTNHSEFTKLCQSEIAAGLDVAYFDLTGDMAAVNFSSSRIGLSQSRDNWKTLQAWLGATVMSRIYLAFLDSANTRGLLPKGLTPQKFAELKRHSWRGRGWAYIQPKDEAEANAIAIQTGQMTLGDVLVEQGKDIDDEIERRISERERFKAAGLEYSAETKKTEEPADEKDPDTGEKKKKKEKES